MIDEQIKHQIFQLVSRRLRHVERCDSLKRFWGHWIGKGAGIEGWFKVEFTAAITPDVAKVFTGSAGGRGKAGKGPFPDLILEFSPDTKVPIELKGGIHSWYYGGKEYRDCLCVSLASSDEKSFARREQKVKTIDPNAQLGPICNVQTSKGERTIYLVMIDRCRYGNPSQE